jgi:putative phage-type endonuclease
MAMAMALAVAMAGALAGAMAVARAVEMAVARALAGAMALAMALAGAVMINKLANSKDWLNARRKILTASAAADVLGFGKYSGALGVWGEKVHGVVQEENIAMRAGHYMEPFITDEYVATTGRNVVDPGEYTIFMHPEIQFLGATIDRLVEREKSGNAGPLELKNTAVGSPRTWVEDSPQFRTQLQVQMACCEASWGALAGLIRCSELVYEDIDRDEEFLQAIYPLLEEFWWHVESEVPPPDNTKFALPAAKKLWPNTDGNTVLLSQDAIDAWTAFNLNAEMEKTHKYFKQNFEAIVRTELGDCTFGDLRDGTYVKKIKAGKHGTRLIRFEPKY